MNYEQFKNGLKANPISMRIQDLSEVRKNILDNEALFQLPFIAMVILMLAKGQSKPSVAELGRLVGECLELSMPAFKKSNQHIAWSANLRVRTVTAMSFLEMARLVEMNRREDRIGISDLGKKVIDKALDEDSDLSYNLHNISRQYRNITKLNKWELKLN